MVLIWASLEGTLRLIAHLEGLKIDEMRTEQLLKKSLSLGLIGKNSYDTFRQGIYIRNAVVHGLKPERLSREFVLRTVMLLTDLISGIMRKYQIKWSEL